MKASSLLRNLQQINLQTMTITAVMQQPEEMPTLNREQLMLRGQDSTGNKLRPYRSMKYARAKNQMNPAPGLGNPDLKLTGAFQRSFFVQASGSKVFLDAHDEKVEKLERKYGDKILGLTDDSMHKYRRQLFPRIMEDFNQQAHRP